MANQPDKKREIPTGPRSIASAIRKPLDAFMNLFRASSPDGDVWMGPGNPTPSSIPEGTPPRIWDYPTFWNTLKAPAGAKASETDGLSFGDLRALAKQTHVRAAINTVIDKQKKKEWAFTVKPIPGESPAKTQQRAETDTRVAEISAFFESPDGETDFAEWLGMFLEDVLGIDAGVVHCWRKINGKPYSLEVFDGSTIMPLLDESGRRPRFPEAAYQQWIKGVPGDLFTTQELMYSIRNPRSGRAFGSSPVQDLLLYINVQLRKDLTRLAHYTDGNIPAGLLPMPPTWNPQQIEAWYAAFNAFLTGLPQNLVKLLPIPGGSGTPVFPQLEVMKDAEQDDLWIRLVCFFFGIPVSSLVKEVTKANGESNRNQADEEGEQVITDFVRRRLNWIVKNWFGYDDIVARPKSELDVDAKRQADIDDVKLKNGSEQLDEIRKRDGKEPFGLPAGVVTMDGSYKPFAASIAAAELAATAPPPPEPVQPPEPIEKVANARPKRIPIPTDTGAVIYVDEDAPGLLTKRGLVPLEQLVTGDELVTVKD
jgi:hypothetical protein